MRLFIALILGCTLGASVAVAAQKPSYSAATPLLISPTPPVLDARVVQDPWESVNRGIFSFNLGLDEYVLEPTAKGYRYITTPAIRHSVRGVLTNLSEPQVFVNAMLQGEIKAAGDALTRFAINTTFGVLGLFDVAGDEGVAWRAEDFGQTLAVWGAGEGSYVMLPFLGPSNIRDTGGRVVDWVMDPVRLVANRFDKKSMYDVVAYGQYPVDAVATREERFEVINDLRRDSLDYYASIRSLYHQNRLYLIENRKPGDAATRSDDAAFEGF
jgi:phospholipid-binding lipoprotein MlaA